MFEKDSNLGLGCTVSVLVFPLILIICVGAFILLLKKTPAFMPGMN
jgi:hypothetical protein